MTLRRRHTLSAFSVGFLAALGSGCPTGSTGTKITDDDGDGWSVEDNDCDDADPSVNPAAAEDCSDGIDNDCDGIVDSCSTDLDGDGYDAPEDCDDGNASVNPGEHEDCYSGVDDNCDGVITTCLDPYLIYEPTSPGTYEPYGVAVFADTVVFGDSDVSGLTIGDGRAVFFELELAVVDELDAAITSEGALGESGAYGSVLTQVGDALCINADYQANGAENNAGKGWCFAEATVQAAGPALALTDAAFTVAGEEPNAYANVEAETDVDGDGSVDLLVSTARGMHVILGNGTPWTGNYGVPSDADLTLGGCVSSGSDWCGFGRAMNTNAPTTLAISEAGGVPDTISLFALPLVGGSTVPTATAFVDRRYSDSATGLELIAGTAFGNSDDREVVFLDGAGAVAGVVAESSASSSFGYWTSSFIDQDGHELLLVSDPDAASPAGGAVGVVYVYDVTAQGLPTDSEAAKYKLVPPSNYHECGWRARGGIVTNDDGTSTTVVLSCPGYGGAAYVLDRRPPPAPLVGPSSIYPTTSNHYEIRQWVVDAYASRLEWILGLAQTEVVVDQGEITGWRLHGIAPGSPLFRAGLRTNDVLRRVNGIDVTSPAVVEALYQALGGASALTVGITRGGVPRLLHYAIVQ